MLIGAFGWLLQMRLNSQSIIISQLINTHTYEPMNMSLQGNADQPYGQSQPVRLEII